MSIDAQRCFLSERAINLHKDYLKSCEVRLSILRKSVDGLPECADGLLRCRTEREIKREAIALMLERDCHRVFFESFCKEPKPSPAVRRDYSSEDALVYELLRLGMRSECGFVCAAVCRGGRVRYGMAEEFYPFSSKKIIAVDICEHAYFLDYGFDKERYLRAALAHLNLSRLDGCEDEINEKSPIAESKINKNK